MGRDILSKDKKYNRGLVKEVVSSDLGLGMILIRCHNAGLEIVTLKKLLSPES